MCGHVGIAGDIEHKDEATMKRLLMFDYFRGTDSTGLAAVRKGDKAFAVAKVASHPLDLFEMGKFVKTLNAFQSQVFIGHNRAATKGVVNTFNAHPYEFDNIVGAHNGTLNDASYKLIEKTLGETFPTDSMAIFAAIDRLGIEETMKLLNGAWALVWYDRRDDSLNFLRNKERPFWYAFSKDCKKLYWASEWPTIEAAMAHSPMKTEFWSDEKYYRFFNTQEDTHYKFDLSVLREGSKDPVTPVMVEREGKGPATVATNSSNVTPFPSPNTGTSGNRGTSSTTLTTTSRYDPNAVLHLDGTHEQPWGGMLTDDDHALMAKTGCQWCGCPLTFEELGQTYLENEGVLLCKNHSIGDPEGMRIYSRNVAKMV